MTLKEKYLIKFRGEYKLAYKGILPDSILDKGNEWFENFLGDAISDAIKVGYKYGIRDRKDLQAAGIKIDETD